MAKGAPHRSSRRTTREPPPVSSPPSRLTVDVEREVQHLLARWALRLILARRANTTDPTNPAKEINNDGQL